MKPPIPSDEATRLDILRQYDLLDTASEPDLDDLTQLAAHICGTPVSLISLVDADRQWFKSAHNFDVRETSRDVSFCAHTLTQPAPLVVPDATADDRFFDNPLVTQLPGIRFYAGAPLRSPEGQPLGTICVIDYEPRQLDASQLEALVTLSRQVMLQFDHRRQGRHLLDRERHLRESEERFSKTFYSSPTALLVARLGDSHILDVNGAFERLSGLGRAQCLGSTIDRLGLMSSEARAIYRTALLRQGSIRNLEFEFRNAAGEDRIGLGSADIVPLHGEPHMVATFIDVTERRLAEVALRAREEELRLALDAAEMGTFDWDMLSDRLIWSRGHERIFGYEPGGFDGSHAAFERRVDPHDLRRLNDTLERCRRERTPYECEFRAIWPDGSVHWVLGRGEFTFDDQGTPVRMRGVVQEVTARKAEEAAAQENEERFREAQRNAGIGSWRYLPDGRLIWSDQMYELFPLPRGVPPTYEALVAVIHPDDRRDGRDTALAEAIASGAQDYRTEYRVIWPGRPTRTLYAQGKIRRDADGGVVEAVGTVQDVTERKQAERRIHKLNRVYAMLSGINETIVREREPDTIFSAACRIAVETGGFRMASIGLTNGGARLVIRAHAGADASTLAVMRALVEREPPAGCVFTARALETGVHAICDDVVANPLAENWRAAAVERGYRSMAVLPLVIDRRTIGVFSIYAGETGVFDAEEMQLLDELATDISFALEMHRRESQRELAEERFRQVVENIQEVFWITSGDRTRMLYVSKAYETIFGRSCDSLYAEPQSWLDAVPADDRERVAEAARTKLALGEFHESFRIIHASGATRWVRARAYPIRHADGHVERIVGFATDITEQRHLEDQFRQAQKMESMGRLAGGIAHDFNNLLTVINGTADLAAIGLEDDDPLRADLAQIRLAGDRAAALTRQLLALSRQQILKPAVISLSTVLLGMQDMLERLLGEDIHLVVAAASDLGSVKADPGQMEQVLLNLAVNARDAMLDGGTLTIETHNVYLDDSYADDHPGSHNGAHVMVAVSDTGVGMDEATRQRIFEPFFTTKELGKGTGLGLSTVYGIVQQSEGTIWVYSEAGQGTTFKIYLPCVDGGVPEAAAAVPVAEVTGTETILLVEDEPALRSLTRRILESGGYTVIEATHGEHALARLDAYEGPLELLLTDVVMPGMNGRELAGRVIERRPDVHVLYASGYTDDAILRHGVLDAASRFISKPYTPTELKKKVREVLDGR